jgi:diguanylate cyclase (GGDEF)-like protein/PAS domain S-box-containing protein
LLDGNGKVVRVVWAAIDIGRIKLLLEKINLPEGTEISVMDANGIIVARHPDAERFTGKSHPLPLLVQAVMANQEEGIGQEKGKDGVTRLFAYHRLLESADMGNIYVSVTVPSNIYLIKSNHAFAQNMGVLGLVTILIFSLAWIGTDILVFRRMKALILSAQQIAQGNFSIRTHLGQGKDEVCELARVFDNMAQSLELLFEQNQRIMEVTPEAMIISEVSGKIVMVNVQAEKLFGYSRDELIGQSIEMLLPERFRAGHGAHRAAYMQQNSTGQMGKRRELPGRSKDGVEFSAEISLGTLKTENGLFAISAVRDITERKQFENQILHQATHDSLTGLPNRALFHDILNHALPHTLRIEKLLVIMFLDLDSFKNINDTLGHGYGDMLLIEIAARLKMQIRKDDMVARQGGDEFTILLQNINDVQDVIQIAEKILNAVSEPYRVVGHEMNVTASMGITVFPFDDTDIDNLLRNADTAMYRAKDAGRNNFQFYTAAMNAAIRDRMEIENGLRYALERNELLLHYQPQVDIESGRIIAVEALVRWMHPEKGLIPPDKFIHIAEESGLIVAIGEWVLRTACKQNKAWQDAGLSHIRMAVNLSARQFRVPHLVAVVVKAMEDAGLALHSDNLELELTESMIMNDVEGAIETLSSLHAMGIRLSIDDFGTGYSSLSYLKRFSINTLKIDQSFIRDITIDSGDAAIAATIIMLGHNLKMRVIAEGVETAGQLEILREMKCDEIQGYYFSKPIPAEELETLLRDERRLN